MLAFPLWCIREILGSLVLIKVELIVTERIECTNAPNCHILKEDMLERKKKAHSFLFFADYEINPHFNNCRKCLDEILPQMSRPEAQKCFGYN